MGSMERIGFFGQNLSEPCRAYDEQIDVKKKLFGGSFEGLEIAIAGANPGMGDGLRKVSALNRTDIATTWRAMIRRGDGKDGPTVSLLAPRGGDTTQAAAKLAAAGMPATGTAGSEAYEVAFPAGTSSNELVRFSVQALQAIGYQPPEWQWTVREKGAYPR